MRKKEFNLDALLLASEILNILLCIFCLTFFVLISTYFAGTKTIEMKISFVTFGVLSLVSTILGVSLYVVAEIEDRKTWNQYMEEAYDIR